MRFSIVTRLYRSENNIREFHRRVRAAVEQITTNLEMILVNDDSPDDSLDVARAVVSEDACVRLIDLSRTFGYQKAIMMGLAHATGDFVFAISCDFEEAPELAPVFYRELQRSGVDVVYGVRGDRPLGPVRRILYNVFDLLCDIPIPRNMGSGRLMTERYVRSLLLHRDREMFLSGLYQLTGYAQLGVPVKGDEEQSSAPHGMAQDLRFLVDAVTAFSNRPLIFIFYMGSGVLALSAIAAFYLIIDRLFFRQLLSGWPSLVISIWLLGGLSIFCLGLIGIYIGKIFTETKDRPYTIVRNLYESKKE